MIIGYAQIYHELEPYRFRSLRVPDRRYFCPTVTWLSEFGDWCARNRKPYMVEKFDCNRFALWARAAANDALYANEAVKDAGAAFGEVDMALIDDGVNGIPGDAAHAACIVRCSDMGWVIFEPQNSRYTLMSACSGGVAAWMNADI